MKKLTMILGGLLTCSILQAANVDSNLSVNVQINHSCILAVTDVNFGIYDQSSEIITTNSFNIKCTKNTPYILKTFSSGYSHKIDIPAINNVKDPGVYSTMINNQDSTQKLYYQMYMPWHVSPNFWNDDMNDIPEFYHAVSNGEVQTLTVQYRLESKQYVAPGNYIGTQSVVLDF